MHVHELQVYVEFAAL